MKNSRGFTLIELLVVIAIIGILSGLIIVSMGGATNSAKDAKIKLEMDQLRSTAVIYYNGNNSSYSGLGDSSEAKSLINDINAQGGANAVTNIKTDGTAYCVIKQLIADASLYWCIDSSGYGGFPTNSSDNCTSSNLACVTSPS